MSEWKLWFSPISAWDSNFTRLGRINPRDTTSISACPAGPREVAGTGWLKSTGWLIRQRSGRIKFFVFPRSKSFIFDWILTKNHSFYLHTSSKGYIAGGMAEWLKAAVLKTVECNSSVGSNPTPSAIYCPREMAELAEGARLLSEWGVKAPPRVRIPLSPPFQILSRFWNLPKSAFCWENSQIVPPIVPFMCICFFLLNVTFYI